MFTRPARLLLAQQSASSACPRWPFLSTVAGPPFFSAPALASSPLADQAAPHAQRRLPPLRRPRLASTLASTDPGRAVTDFLTGPLSEQLTFGGVTGFATGYALSRLGRLALLAVGIQVLSLQAMAHRGWVSVHWSVIAADVDPSVRAGRHGGMSRVIDLAAYRVPFAGAFTAVSGISGRTGRGLRGGCEGRAVGGRGGGWGAQRRLAGGGLCAGWWLLVVRADCIAAAVGSRRWGRRGGCHRPGASGCVGLLRSAG